MRAQTRAQGMARKKHLKEQRVQTWVSLQELFTEAKETERPAKLVRGSSHEALKNLSHYFYRACSETAGEEQKNHPNLAARLWYAQRIAHRGRKKQ